MPSANNDSIADFLVELGWFQSQMLGYPGLPSDNWRFVKDTEGRTAILYIVIFHSTSESGEPSRIPNEPDALPRLAEFHRKLSPPKSGPFIALAEISGESDAIQIINVRVWNIAARISDSVNTLAVAELRNPDFRFPRMSGL